jgi:endonuclease/exonuclease/phosphatase family metal-dependent hydrolase
LENLCANFGKAIEVPMVANDNISKFLGDLVPKELESNDRFLDLISWNIKFFNPRDPERVDLINSIMQELNADIFVLQEIEDGALDDVVLDLNDSGAGLYKVVYGTTGGDIRVAIMYDMEWVKAKTDIKELFPEKPTIMVGRETKEIFPRLPLEAQFMASNPSFDENRAFDFHLVGVHLKSQRGPRRSVEQRTAAAQRLAAWMMTETLDEDVIIMGDWNAAPNLEEWQVFRDLEARGEVDFQNWNPANEGSFLTLSGRQSRLDFIVISSDVKGTKDIQDQSKVISWTALEGEGSMNRDLLKSVIDTISDHLPVVTRFFFTEPE